MRKSIFILVVVFWLGVFIVPPANSFAQMTMKKPLPLTQQNQATIVAITPNSVTLKQGEAAVIVTVDGKYLETVQSVLAVKGGLGFSEISAKLVQPWPASRKIELQATANAPVGRGYQLRFFGKAGLMNFRIDVPLAVFSLEVAGKPTNQQQIKAPVSTLPTQTQTTFKLPVTMVSPKAEIIAITPKTVSLEQGGPPAVVNVEGKYLETILSVLVMRGFRGFGWISAKLVQPWPASRKIELQAGATAPIAKDYQLRFIGKAGREDFRIDVPLTVFSLAVHQLCDLVVQEAYFEYTPTNKLYWLVVKIKNLGPAPIKLSQGLFIWKTVNAPQDLGWAGSIPNDVTINPGDIYKPSTSAKTYLPSGTFTIKIKVDPHNLVPEASEVNNELSITVTLPSDIRTRQ